MKRKELLVMSIGVFLTIVAWVIIEVYKIQNQDVQGNVSLPKIEKHRIDTAVIEQLRQKTE